DALRIFSQVRGEATRILARPETGSRAIGAETEAIELLLQSKRFNPGGGGGGANPGGGGGGTTNDSALTLLRRRRDDERFRAEPARPRHQREGSAGRAGCQPGDRRNRRDVAGRVPQRARRL